MPRQPSVTSLIKDLEAAELREVILELCKLSAKNKQFLRLYLQGSDTADLESVVSEAKKKIHGHFWGRAMLPKMDIAGARKVVLEYSKVLKEYPAQIADLKLYYVENGTELTNEFGDMNEGYYSSMESMFDGFCKLILTYPHYYKQFEDRIRALNAACEGIGWGYGYTIGQITFEMEESIQAGRSPGHG